MTQRRHHFDPLVAIEVFHQLAQVGGVDLPEPLARDAQPDRGERAAERCHHLPGDDLVRERPADQPHQPLHHPVQAQPAQEPQRPHIGRHQPHLTVGVGQLQVVDPDHFEAIGVDDLRIEDITQEHLVRLEWPGLQEAAGDPEADLLGGEALDRVPGDQRHPAAVRTHAQSRYPRQRIPQVDGHVPDGAQPDAIGIDDWRMNEPAEIEHRSVTAPRRRRRPRTVSTPADGFPLSCHSG